MSITDPRLVNIEIATLPNRGIPGLRLTYQNRKYDLLQAFSTHKLDAAQHQWQHLMSLDRIYNPAVIDRYLLVGEVGYYSLWALDRGSAQPVQPAQRNDLQREPRLELQQASLWLFQELWLQWQDLVGARQLTVFAENLVAHTPQLQSRTDVDRLLELDPLTPTRLLKWTELDFKTFDRQLYHLTQQKIGHQFGKKIAIEIIESMPELLRSSLVDTLDI
ncbi:MULTISPECIES: hypothetical protein [unclassified Chamaesiphon]|uniref:Npun_F0813 family protein n=1 Tax=unclassified Chamaesiphon TaxID=2620921 RepID=UPI00286CB644|nr:MULTISPECIES: hypothetical protein [unclassified Chamaesiphon]